MSNLGDRPIGVGQWVLAVPESLKEVAANIICPHPIPVLGKAAFPKPTQEEKDDWAYDEAKDNELQDKLAGNEPLNNPAY